MASVRKLLLLSVFVASTVAVPVSQQGQCARYCTDENDFSLRPGNTYTYDYETTTVTTVQGSSQDKTQLQMTAQADIEVISKCELSLRLRGVTLKLSDPESPEYLVSLRGARDFARTIERHILRFSFQNGQVEHVCPSENVPAWVTNIQKGVLSAFQTYKVKPEWTTRTLETDILGKCTAEYQSLGRSWQGAHTIRKLKDLASCTERENIQTYLQGTPYSQDFTQSLPAVKGNQECEQVISESFLQTSTCNEKLTFRPFSSRSNGVVTTVSQKLIFAAVGERRFTGNDYRPTTELLLFSHAKEEVSSAKIEEETEFSLKELCEASKDDISISVPRKFSTFVYKLKELPLRSLKTLYQKTENLCPGNPKSRKFFMDAIPLVGTSDSAHFMYEMITRKTISESESSLWLTSLSFVTDTTPEVIATFTPLLEGRFDQAILGISALIRNYCNGKDCSNVPEVQAAVNKLTENLGENCFSAEDKRVILSLKAIGNIGYIFGKENLLEACYKNPQIRTEARLAAIDAFRRLGCDVNREELLKTYSNYNEDTEIRISAYLAVMKCPDFSIIQAVKNVMMKETINHVGSFIWTHLNALSKSRHPERQEIKDIISNLYLLNKFASDARKFSTAHEATFFLESIDSGIHVDSHLIFSTDSYLPKTAMFNLTVDVFGKTCNLFQIDGRIEGLERVAENFFGPNGYFPQKNVAKLLRERRSLDNNKLTAIDNQFKAHLRNQQQPYGSLDVKVFGTSMWYDQFRMNDDGTPEITLMDFVTTLAQEKDKEYSRSFTFLDTTFTIPMTSGLPLKIALNGTASVGLKIGGKFDVKSFEHVDIFGHIEPSGAIEIASLLTVDAGNVARSGMRVVSTMHSSSVLDGKVQVKNGEVVKLQLNMPKDRIDVFNIQSKLYLVHGLEEKEKTSDKKAGTHLESCTGKTTTRLLGVKFCSELELPAYRANSPLHPLNGPARLNLFIQKTDPSLKSYNFDAQWLSEKKNGRYGVLSFNTPDSTVDRDVKVELYLNQNDHSATLKVKTPVKKIGANAKLVNSDSQKKLDFSVTFDEKDYFSFQSELGIKADKSSAVYTPSLEIKIPNRRLVAVTGLADLKYNQKYTAQLKIEELTEKPILSKVNLEMGKRDRYDIEMSLNSFPLDGTVKGFAQLGDSMSSRLTADYRILEGKMNKLNIIGKVRNLSANALTKYTGQLNIQASVIPEWNTEIQFETMKTTGHIENTVSLSLGDGARSRVHTIRMQEILRYEGSLTNNKVDASITLAYPEKNINYFVNMNHENTDHSLKNVLQVQYATKKQVSSEVQLKMATGNLLSVSGDVQVKYPGREAGLQAELSQSGQKEYRGAVTCQWQQGRQAGAVVQYKDRSDGSRIKYEVEGSLNLPSSNPITFSSTAGYHQGQLAAFADLNMRGNKYRAKVDVTAGNGFNHRVSGQLNLRNDIYGLDASTTYIKDRFSSNLEIKMPNRHRATSRLECKIGDSMKFGLFETYWDADRDTSKRFSVSGELRSQSEGYDAKVSMQVLRRNVKGVLSTSLQGNLFSSQWKTNNKLDLEWSPSEKVSGVLSMNVLFNKARQQINNHIEITTPYYGYENVSLSFTHLFTNQQWNSELSTLLPKGNDVTLSSSGKYSFVRGDSLVETTAKAQSSFAGFEELLITVSHRHNAKELSNKAEMRWGMDKTIFYQLTGTKQASTVKGSVKIGTPFAYARDLSGEINYSQTGNTYRTSGAVQWSPSKRLSLVAEGNHELNGRRRTCTISLEGSSPYRGYENTGMKITYSNDGITLSTDSEMTWNRNKITTAISVSRRNQMYNQNIEGKFVFRSPFRNYETVQVSTSMEMNQNSYKINVDTEMPYRSTASFNSQGKLISLNDIEVNAIVIGNAPRYMKNSQRISLDLVHKFQNSKLRSSLDTSYGEDRLTVLLTGSVESGYSSRNIEISATVNTPFQGFEELKTEFTHNQRGYEYVSKIQANKNREESSLTHKLNIRDLVNFETTLELTSTSSLPTGKLSITLACNGRQLEHNSYIEWDKNKKLHLNAQYLDKTFLKEAVLKITTPFRSYREMELKSSIETQDREHKGILSLVWDRRNKMTLSGDFKNYQWQSMNSQVEFTSPFRGYEFFSTAVKYDTTGLQKEGEVSFLWDVNNRKSITAKTSFLQSRRLIQLDGSLTTPFDGFDTLSLSTKYESISPNNVVVIQYERGSRKITFEGRTTMRHSSSEVSVELSTPFRSLRELSSSVKYSKTKNGLKGEVTAEWNRVNKYKATTQYELTKSSGKGHVEVLTSLRGYEKVTMDVSGSYENSKLTSEAALRWDDKKISASADVYNTQENGEMNLKIQTPFYSYNEISLFSKYKAISQVYEGEIQTTLNEENLFQGSAKVKYGGSRLLEIEVNFDTPVSPFKNVKMSQSVDYTPDMYQLDSTLKWEDKEGDISILLNKKSDQFYEAKMKLNTPFKDFKLLSFESSLQNDRNRFLDGRVTIVTPFEYLRSFDAYGEFKNVDSGNSFELKVETPQKKANIKAKLTNSQFRPLIASLEIEAPFTNFRKLSSDLEVKVIQWNDAKVKFSTNSASFQHEIEVSLEQNDSKLNFEAKAKSTAFSSRKAILSVKSNYEDPQRVTVEASAELFGNVHYLNGQYKYNGRNMDAQLEIESPLLPERKSGMGIKFNRRRNDKVLDGEISFSVPSSNHQITAKYENKGNQISANLKIDSILLSSSTLETQAKYINSNNKNIEMAFAVLTPAASHSITGSLVNYDGEKTAQLKVECSAVSYLNPFTITSTLKHTGYKTMDGSISITTPGKEVRIAGNMKNEGAQNIEAFLTINTPFEALKMLRLDGQFRNDRYQNIECNFQLETSNPSLQLVGATSKFSRTESSDEMSLMLRLPLRNYRQVQILGNAHYNLDYSSADSRITITLPRSKYAVYGQYGIGRTRVSGKSEIEINNQKWSVIGRLERSSEKKDLSLSFVTPTSQAYTVGGAYGKSGSQHHLAATYNSPSNDRYSWNSTMSYENLGNFAIDFQVETPFYKYRNIQGSVQQQSNPTHLSTNVEYTKDGRRGFLKVNHRIQRDGLKGTIQMGCPYSKLRDVKLSYNRVKKYTNTEDSVELDYNRAKQLKMEVILFGERSSHVVLDVPALPLTVTADSKQLSNGREINFRSNYFTRVVSFRSSHQLEARQILHAAAFSWDERSEKRISYDFKLSKTESGQELWTRLDTPLRSLMLKGNFTKTSRARSGGVDFFWDASRSLEKHVAVGLVHTDISTDKQTSHRVQLVMEHPKLSKDIVQTNVINYSPSEFHVKSELHYSRERQHNLVLEMKANDLSRSIRESHYKSEVSLRHPASRIDLRAVAEMMDGKLESSGHLRLESQDRTQTRNIRELKLKIMKLRQEIKLALRSNGDEVDVSGQVSGRNGEYDINLQGTMDQQPFMTARAQYSRRNRALDVSIMNNDNSGLQLSVSYPKESASLKISHSNRGQLVSDVNLFLGLEESKLLKSKLNWRPKLLEDLRINTGESLRYLIRAVRAGYTSWASSFSQEWSTRVSLMSRAMADLLAPFVEDVKNGAVEIQRDLSHASDAFWRMYTRNEFYMRDIVASIKIVKQVAKDVAIGISIGCEVLYNITMEQLEHIYDTIYYSYLELADYMQKVYSDLLRETHRSLRCARKALKRGVAVLVEKMNDFMERSYLKLQKWSERMILKFDKWVRSYAPCIIDGYYYVKHTADRIRYYINGVTTTVSVSIRSNPYYIGMRNYADSVMTTIRTFRDYEYTLTAQAFLNRIYDIQIMDNIINHPTVDYMSDIANSALKKSVEVYHNLGLDVVAANLVETGSNYVKTVALNSAQEYLSEFYQTKAGAKYEFAPQRGVLSLEFSLPASRNSLVEVFDVKSYPEYQKMMSASQFAAEYYEDFCIWDFYYKVLKYFTPNYWLPAFSAHALISGNQHFITFDKLSYDFAGKCSYLLARDFVDGNFTAIVNYGTEDHMRRSLTILVDGRKVDIGNDYKITLDDTKTELPIQIKETVVIREGSNIRVENGKKGFSVVCNFVHNYCSVSVSGFYFGKTAGLFGTFNYEPSLDMMTPARYVMGDIESFVGSWEVGQGVCQSENYATLPSNDYKVQRKCKELFEKSTSQYRPCFKQVDPETYLNMCIRDLAAVHENDHNDALCESAAAYFIECKAEGVAVKMPKHCVRCEKQDGSYMMEGEAIQFPRDGKVTAADVVFLVEEKGCNKDRVKYLSKFAQSIEDNYRQIGYKDVRYSVVGFGGDAVHSDPHIHTLDGRESGPLRSLESALQSLQYGDGPVNILEAIRFAAALTYRPGTAKNFILMKCSTCKSEELKAEYSEMLRTLLDGDITLHLLMEQKFEMKIANKNSKARRVIGVDKKFAYTLKDVKDTRLSGDGDLLAQLKIPKDVCIPLAFEVNGTSFDSQFLTETKKNTNKKFIDVLSRIVVRTSTMSTPDWGMCCECLATEDGVGKSACQRCVSAEVASMISADTFELVSPVASEDSRNAPKSRPRKHKERRSGQ